MNNKFLGLAVVFAVLIIPIMAGFMMPSDTTTEVDYEIGVYNDVTKSMENSTTPGSAYNSTYINNQYTIGSNPIYGLNTRTNETTTIMNSYPKLSVDTTSQVTLPANSQQTWNLTSLYTSPSVQLVLLDPYLAHITDSDGNACSAVYYYPGTKLCYGMENSLLVAMDPTKVNIEVTNNIGGYITQSFYAQDTDASGKPLYMDPNSGFVAGWEAGYGYVWCNTRENTIVAFVVDPTEQPWLVINAHDSVRLMVDANGEITARIVYNNAASLSDLAVGNVSAYPYVLITIDTIEDKIMVSGLVNMSSFTTFPTGHIGNTVTQDIEDIPAIKTLMWDRPFGTSPTYSFYVPYTYALSEGTACIEDNTLSVGSYYPGKTYYAFMMASTTLYGDSMTFNFSTAGDLTYTFAVEDGKLKDVPTDQGTVDIPVSALTVYLIPVTDSTYTVKFNDYTLDEIEKNNSYAKLDVFFQGSWKTTALVTSSTATTKDVYIWGGGFNIDFTTFCGIGVLVAFCLAIIAGMYYRSTETGILPIFLAIAAGVIYIALLFSVIE